MLTELKVVMFTDQVESTANTTWRTHKQVEQVTCEQHELTSEVLRQTRGVLLKDTGDGCLAQFPGVLEAVQAGMLLQKRVGERNATQNIERMRFELHVGIDVGDLIVLRNGDLRGEAANRCARLCSECPAGQIYLSDVAARALKRTEVEIEPVPAFRSKGIKGLTRAYRVTSLWAWPEGTLNPFIWRGGITHAKDFFGREQEQRILRAYLRGRQNCQIVGSRRIGKTSLLRQIERTASKWSESTIAIYLDLQDPRCFSLKGWLSLVSRLFNWRVPAVTLAEFSEGIEIDLMKGVHPVLCLDEFEELRERSEEFSRDFFMALRSCSQRGLSIVTVSQSPLSQITNSSDPSSPFYNTFPLLRLGPFAAEDAADFVSVYRAGVPPFNAMEKQAILDFANGHPLALQTACFNVLESKDHGQDLTSAIQKSAHDLSDMKVVLCDGR